MFGSDYLYKRVEITGINAQDTSSLSDKERDNLIAKMKSGDANARNRLVLSNIKLVLSIIQKVNIRNAEPDDLFQVGCIGLIKALNNFNPDMNIKFSTYGVVMILGEIKRYIRDNQIIKVSRSTKDLAFKAINFKEEYIKVHEMEPSTDEMARYLGTTSHKIRNAFDAISPTISLYEPAFEENSEGVYLLDQISYDSFEEAFCTKIIVQDIFKNLKPREKEIMNLRFVQGKTQTQVSNIIGISQAQVSRIEKNIISNVKKQLKS